MDTATRTWALYEAHLAAYEAWVASDRRLESAEALGEAEALASAEAAEAAAYHRYVRLHQLYMRVR